MRKERPLIQDILKKAEKRKEASLEREEIVNRIVSSLGTFLTERGGWDSDSGKVNDIGTFPILDGDESKRLFYGVNIGFGASDDKLAHPDCIRIKVYEDNNPHNEETLLTVTQGKNRGKQVFKVEDQLGREINKVPELKEVEKLIDNILVYGRTHIHPINKSASTSQ